MKKLSIEEMKKVMGGNMGSGDAGNCVRCYVNEGQQSCWFTNDTPSGLCARVYPNGLTSAEVVPCDSSCIMN